MRLYPTYCDVLPSIDARPHVFKGIKKRSFNSFPDSSRGVKGKASKSDRKIFQFLSGFQMSYSKRGGKNKNFQFSLTRSEVTTYNFTPQDLKAFNSLSRDQFQENVEKAKDFGMLSILSHEIRANHTN